MIFGFEKIEHKEFKKNFLRTVVFQISFNKVNSFPDKRKEIIDYFKTFFPRISSSSTGNIEISFKDKQTPIVQHTTNNNNIEMKSHNAQKSLVISDNTLILNISGQEYKNFTQLKKEIEQIQGFFTCCGIKELTRISLRKVNIVDFKNTGDNAIDMLNLLIEPSLLGDTVAYQGAQFLKQDIHNLSYRNGAYIFNIKYGLNLPSPPMVNLNILNPIGLGQVLIDFDLIMNGKVTVSDIFNVSDDINNEIYSAFNWIITDKFLNLLNEY